MPPPQGGTSEGLERISAFAPLLSGAWSREIVRVGHLGDLFMKKVLLKSPFYNKLRMCALIPIAEVSFWSPFLMWFLDNKVIFQYVFILAIISQG